MAEPHYSEIDPLVQQAADEHRRAHTRASAYALELLEALEEMTNAAAALVAGKPVRNLDERLLIAAKLVLKAKGEQP